MPIIQAANIPSPTAPTISPAPTPGSDYQNIPAGPESFGSPQGAALSNLGREIGVSSDVLAKHALELQTLRNHSDANDAFLDATINVGKLEAEFKAKQGKEAVDAYPAYQQQLLDLRNQYKANLPNPETQRLFDDNFRRSLGFAIRDGAGHAALEQRKGIIRSNQAVQENQLGDISNNPEQEDRFQSNLATMLQSADATSLALGYQPGSPEWEAARGKITSRAYLDRIKQLAQTNPVGAADLLAKSREKLADSAMLEQAQHQVSQGLLGAGATGIAQDILSGQSGHVSGTGVGHVAPNAERVAFARSYAQSKGINPDAVTATIFGEGVGRYVGDGGTSFGDFQLHVGGGMGDKAVAAGIDVRNPNTWKEQTKFAIDQMAANKDKGAEWYAGQWHGAPAWAAASFANPGAAAPGAKPLAVGDSIAAHLIRKAGAAGAEHNFDEKEDSTAVAGHNPQQVLDLINKLPDAQVKGQNVILSSGASNGPDQLDQVEKQIATLRAKGAQSITLLGVGTADKLKGVNDKLADIAGNNQVAFAGPLRNVAGDGIHSSDPKATLAQALQAQSLNAPTPTAPAQRSLGDLEKDADARVDALAARGVIVGAQVDTLRQRIKNDVRAQFNQGEAIRRQGEQMDMNSAQTGVILGANGDGETPYKNLNEYLASPTLRKSYERLSPAKQIAIQNLIANRAKKIPLTSERQSRYLDLYGMSITDPETFAAMDFTKEDLPATGPISINSLLGVQKKLIQKAEQPVDFMKGLSLLKNTGRLPEGFEQNKPVYHQFAGAYRDRLDEIRAEKKRQPTPDEMLQAGSEMLRQVTHWSLSAPFTAGRQMFQVYVPPKFRNEFMQKYRSASGQDPTNEQVIDAYHKAQTPEGNGPAASTGDEVPNY